MKSKILIIEDEDQIRLSIIKMLQINNYDVISANNGADGIDIAIKHKPDLIISDIMMPGVNGYEVITELKKYQDTYNIPFLFLTAKSNRIDIREGMNLGADDYLTKPFEIDELLSAVQTQLQKKIDKEKINQVKFEDLRQSIRRSLPHEIRTPLSIILGYSELLLNKIEIMPVHDIKDMVGDIYSSAKRLNRLFENYLIYAQLELLSANPNEIKKLLTKKTYSAKTIISDFAMYHAKKHQRTDDIKFDLEETDLMISTEYFAKIIEEIIDNALKFSEPNTEISLVGFKQKAHYNIVITDYGRGMKKEQIGLIGAYQQFERIVYEQQGLGLGLIIAKKIAELHKGDLVIESEPDKFTTVKVSLLYNEHN